MTGRARSFVGCDRITRVAVVLACVACAAPGSCRGNENGTSKGCWEILQRTIPSRFLPRPVRNPPSRKRYGAAGERGEGKGRGEPIPVHWQADYAPTTHRLPINEVRRPNGPGYLSP